MSSTNISGPHGAAILAGRDPSDILAAAPLSTGGMVCMDLFQPDRLHELVLTHDQAQDSTLRSVADRASVDANAGAPIEVPQGWLRWAFTSGIDRWLDHPLDEGLLAADLAAAATEAGLNSRAEQLQEEAAAALGRTVDALHATPPGRRPAALIDAIAETVTHIDGPQHLHDRVAQLRRERSHRPNPATPPSSQAADSRPSMVAGYEHGQRRARGIDPSGLSLTAGGGLSAVPEPAPTTPTLVLDQRCLPARMFRRETATLTPNGSSLALTMPAYQDVSSSNPVSQRFTFRAYLSRTNTTISRGTIDLRDGSDPTFHADIPGRDADPANITVEVRDALSTIVPRSADESEATALAQTLLTTLHQMSAHHAVWGAAGSQEADHRLDTLARKSVGLNGVPDRNAWSSIFHDQGPGRPLVCELEAAWTAMDAQ